MIRDAGRGGRADQNTPCPWPICDRRLSAECNLAPGRALWMAEDVELTARSIAFLDHTSPGVCSPRGPATTAARSGIQMAERRRCMPHSRRANRSWVPRDLMGLTGRHNAGPGFLRTSPGSGQACRPCRLTGCGCSS